MLNTILLAGLCMEMVVFPLNKQEAINWFQKVEAQGGAQDSKFWLKKLLEKKP